MQSTTLSLPVEGWLGYSYVCQGRGGFYTHKGKGIISTQMEGAEEPGKSL